MDVISIGRLWLFDGFQWPKQRLSLPMVKLNLSQFKFDKDRGILSKVENGCFPRELIVVSHHTGRKMKFTPIQFEHPMYDEDHWDGEQAIYEPTEQDTNVKVLILYHNC
jgi:hypothetical protein